MSKSYRLLQIGVVFLFVLSVLLLLAVLSFATATPASADGGSIEFDERVIDLRGASTVTIESWREITAYGDVTVTTSIVTVTVWSKP